MFSGWAFLPVITPLKHIPLVERETAGAVGGPDFTQSATGIQHSRSDMLTMHSIKAAENVTAVYHIQMI